MYLVPVLHLWYLPAEQSKMVLKHRSCLVWWLISVTMVSSFTIRVTGNVRMETAPLVGGPTWLPLHVKVVVDEQNVFDFVPINATSVETLKNLLTFQDVPAEVRTRQLSRYNNTSEDARRAILFCNDYNKDLHLIKNNCWTFAYELLQFIFYPEK